MNRNTSTLITRNGNVLGTEVPIDNGETKHGSYDQENSPSRIMTWIKPYFSLFCRYYVSSSKIIHFIVYWMNYESEAEPCNFELGNYTNFRNRVNQLVDDSDG